MGLLSIVICNNDFVFNNYSINNDKTDESIEHNYSVNNDFLAQKYWYIVKNSLSSLYGSISLFIHIVVVYKLFYLDKFNDDDWEWCCDFHGRSGLSIAIDRFFKSDKTNKFYLFNS